MITLSSDDDAPVGIGGSGDSIDTGGPVVLNSSSYTDGGAV